jgi:uncharacterized protein (DUF983 family)
MIQMQPLLVHAKTLYVVMALFTQSMKRVTIQARVQRVMMTVPLTCVVMEILTLQPVRIVMIAAKALHAMMTVQQPYVVT